MELAGWNQLLANGDFPTGPGLGKEAVAAAWTAGPTVPWDRSLQQGWGRAQDLATAHMLLTGSGRRALATRWPRSLPDLRPPDCWFIPTPSCPNESTDQGSLGPACQRV